VRALIPWAIFVGTGLMAIWAQVREGRERFRRQFGPDAELAARYGARTWR
jgi:hypothetical protein